MSVVPAADEQRNAKLAQQRWERIVFLPWYPELSDEAVEQLATLIADHKE
jgi:hypothetical protein